MAVRVFGTRLAVEGDAQYKQKMRDAGRVGQDAMQRVGRSAVPASRGLRVVSAAGVELRQSLQGVAGQVPVIGRLTAVLGPAGLAFGAVAGGMALAVGGIARGARTAAAEIAAIGDAADRVQIDVELFEKLKAALTLEGQADNGLEVALATFVKQSGEAVGGAKSIQQAFGQLGISMSELARLTPEDALMRVSDGLAAIPDPAQRAALAQRLFGEQGRALLTVLDDGSEALKRQFEAADRLGLLMGGEVIRTAQQLNIEFDRQAKIVDLQLKKAFLEAGPAVSSLRENFVQLIPVILEFVGAVAAGVNELLALLNLANRPARVQLAVNVEDLESVRQQIMALEEDEAQGLGLRGMFGSGSTLERLREEERRLLEANGQLSQKIREEEAFLESLRNQPAVTVNVPSVPPAVGGGGGASGKGRKTPERDAFAEEVARIRERTEALRFEAETAGMAAEVIAYLESVRRLESAATADGTAVSREERQAIVETASAQAQATAAKERGAQASRDLADAEREAQRQAEDMMRSLDEMSSTVGGSLGGLIAGTNTWRDALGEVLDVALRIGEEWLQKSGLLGQAGGFVSSFIGGLFGGGFADGAAFRHGQVIPFGSGTVISQPTLFPMSGGRTGLMGERGAEAIMPLVETASGALGVRAEGGGGGGVTYAPVYQIDARGAVEGTAVMIERAITAYDRQIAASSIRNAAHRQRA